MSSHKTLLDLLKSNTQVDCDTLDSEVPKRFGLLVDCTSNQAIAYAELQKSQHEQLLEQSVKESTRIGKNFDGVSQDELAVEIVMIRLSLGVAPHISGMVHTQTNPRRAYDTEATISNALRIVSLYKHLSPTFDASRVCIKIPSTFEGLQACRVLQSKGIETLATTLFTLEQAVLAADAGCCYIAPYLHALRVQTDASYHDPTPEFALCVSAQQYFKAHRLRTKVLAASFASTDDVMKLAGIDHVTLPPLLLEQLTELPVSAQKPKSLFEEGELREPPTVTVSAMWLHDREAFVKATEGRQQKLSEAIGIFCEMQGKLEDLMQRIRKGKDI